MLALEQRREMFEFSAVTKYSLLRIFSLCHLDVLFQTHSKQLSSFWNLELEPEMVSYSDFSSLHCKRQSTGCLCLSVLSRFFCEEAKPVGFFWLTCFYSFSLFLFSWICKALTSCTELSRVTKCPEWFCFWKWGYREIRWFWGHIFLFLQWKLKTNNFSVCVCVCMCAYKLLQ